MSGQSPVNCGLCLVEDRPVMSGQLCVGLCVPQQVLSCGLLSCMRTILRPVPRVFREASRPALRLPRPGVSRPGDTRLTGQSYAGTQHWSGHSQRPTASTVPQPGPRPQRARTDPLTDPLRARTQPARRLVLSEATPLRPSSLAGPQTHPQTTSCSLYRREARQEPALTALSTRRDSNGTERK